MNYIYYSKTHQKFFRLCVQFELGPKLSLVYVTPKSVTVGVFAD